MPGRLMRRAIPLAVAICVLSSGLSAAPAWQVIQDEVTALMFGDPGDALIAITCGRNEQSGADETGITVRAEPGTKPPQGPVVLVLESKDARKELPLKPNICGKDECSDRAEGEVSIYATAIPGLRPAFEIAEKATRISIDAPGAKVSASADEQQFVKFAGLCRNW
jgi:hypothetical protein